MIQGRIIVCIGNAWEDDPTSKHHVMRILSGHNDIVWINYRGSRPMQASSSDMRSAAGALRRIMGGTTRVAHNITQTTPLVIPGAAAPLARRVHQRLLLHQIRRAIRRVPGYRHKPVQIWSYAFDVGSLIGHLHEECFVYCCTDEYCEFEGFDRDWVRSKEAEMMRGADLVVTTAEALQHRRLEQRPDAELVPHGVEFNHFTKAWLERLDRPADLPPARQPIVGFFGLLHYWIDCELIARLARLRPDYAFVLIGDRKVDCTALEREPNVYLLGRRPFADLPGYCSAFDAGLMPFARSELTRNVNPIKLYEYLAAGLPVISTPLPAAELMGWPVYIAESPGQLALACDEAIAEKRRVEPRRIAATVQDRSWLATVERLSGLVTAAMTRRPAAAGEVASMPPAPPDTAWATVEAMEKVTP